MFGFRPSDVTGVSPLMPSIFVSSDRVVGFSIAVEVIDPVEHPLGGNYCRA